jgi:hypothetical protein
MKRLAPAPLSLLALLASCVSREEMNRPPDPLPAPSIEKLMPAVTAAGVGFAVQPGGDSAISVIGSGFRSGSKVRFDSRVLNTTFGGRTNLTALVPAELYRAPGLAHVTVENPDAQISNEARFIVLEDNLPAPVVTRLAPASTVQGKSFNVQPDGASALAVEGANFLPCATIDFGGKPLPTTFGSAALLTAVVPGALLGSAGDVEVVVKNPGGKESYPATFRIAHR